MKPMKSPGSKTIIITWPSHSRPWPTGREEAWSPIAHHDRIAKAQPTDSDTTNRLLLRTSYLRIPRVSRTHAHGIGIKAFGLSPKAKNQLSHIITQGLQS